MGELELNKRQRERWKVIENVGWVLFHIVLPPSVTTAKDELWETGEELEEEVCREGFF